MRSALDWIRTGGGRAALALIAAACPVSPLAAQSTSALAERIQRVMDRPEFRHALFGIEFYSLDSNKPIYTLNADKLFVPGSTTKLLTEGTALELMGAEYRFHTRVYRTGAVDRSGTLDGDLVLVASGDPNLSGRVRSDGTLAFENEDHAYDGDVHTRAVPGDPLLVIRKLAGQVAAHGVKRIARACARGCHALSERRPRARHRCRDVADRRERQSHRPHDRRWREDAAPPPSISPAPVTSYSAS